MKTLGGKVETFGPESQLFYEIALIVSQSGIKLTPTEKKRKRKELLTVMNRVGICAVYKYITITTLWLASIVYHLKSFS